MRRETELEIHRSLALVRSIDGPAMTVISGAPGVGKTQTLLRYAQDQDQAAVYVAIAKGEGNPSHVAAAVLRQAG